MNALAQNVTKLSKDYEALKKKCRQQQAEIEALKAHQLELTDEEIEELIWNTTDMKDFARAILRKAQEK